MPLLLPSTSPPSLSHQPIPSPLSTTTIMAPQVRWETFSDEDNSDDDEALSLSDLPKATPGSQEKECKSSEPVLEDFEFRTSGISGGFLFKELAEPDMCPADDIFFQGQLLPLRPSFDSRSYDWQSNPSSGGFDNSRSLSSNNSTSSSNCSSSCVSRSQSSSSHSSINCDLPPRQSTSNKFYAHPSPRPQVRTKVVNSGRKSTGTAPSGWAGVLRLGVVKVPEIEINDLRLRKLRVNDNKRGGATVVKKSTPRFGFGCRCAPNVTEPVLINPARPLIEKKKKEVKLEREESVCRSSRVFEWLEEVSIRKGSVNGLTG